MGRRKAFSALGSVLVLFAGWPCAAQDQRPAPRSMRFKMHSYMDRQGIGTEAFRLLVPAGWRFQGGIQWTLQSPAMPAIAAFTVTSPDGTSELEVFPNELYTWNTSPQFMQMFPRGSRYLGSVVLPPMTPGDYARQVLLPRHRRGVKDLRIVQTEAMPDLARAHQATQPPNPYAQTAVHAARVRVEYGRNGQPAEEEVYAVIQTVNLPMQTLYGVVQNRIWTPDCLFAFRARRGALAGQRKVFETMVRSFKLNPQWYSKYNQVVTFLTQQKIQQIRHIGQISRIVSQTSNEISDMIMSSYEKRQKVYDRLATDFSRTTRGVEGYVNPATQTKVELPNGYGHAWSTGAGEYVLTDDPTYDPNRDSQVRWNRLDKDR